MQNKICDAYDLAFDFHYDLVSIHPFGDGNGRTSRLMMNFILESHSYPLNIIFKEDKTKYLDALIESRKTETSDPIKGFLYSQQIKYFNNELTKHKDIDKGIFLTFL